MVKMSSPFSGSRVLSEVLRVTSGTEAQPDHLLKSEQIVKGKMVSMTFDPNSSKVAEISVAAKYADSLKLDLKDRLMIEVSGVPIEAEIVNIRRVKWTSFQPNFFVQMQPGVLEDAPKTFIATVHDLDSDEKHKLQDQLVKQFHTISILDIERTGQKILEIISKHGSTTDTSRRSCRILLHHSQKTYGT